MKFSSLPKIGEAIDDGIFAGVTTRPDGIHCAVILLKAFGYHLTKDKAIAWVQDLNAELPSKAVASMLVENVWDKVPYGQSWVGCDDFTFSWIIEFGTGYMFATRTVEMSYNAVAVRLIPIE